MHKQQVEKRLIGPFRELISMRDLPLWGALQDEQLEIIQDGGVLMEGEKILAVGNWEELRREADPSFQIEELEGTYVGMPGLIDAHTHLCFAGSRALDYAARNAGKSYLDIAREGGGIWSSVRHSRDASQAELLQLMLARMDRLIGMGVTTVEIKSGYGLGVEEELHLLQAIKQADSQHAITVIPCCLAAHIVPPEFSDENAYLSTILNELVPRIQQESLCERFDIFIEESAFSSQAALPFLQSLKKQGFQLTVHGDQFTPGGSEVAIQVGALSVDHLEASGPKEVKALAASKVIATALPGASIGLGCAFTPARALLDGGAALAIASDWNPGSAPMGNLWVQAAILGTFEKLSTAEIFAGITYRAAQALGISDSGKLDAGCYADLIAFPTSDYREILYHQGQLLPQKVWKEGQLVKG